jgi:hypothetical protein
MKKIVLMLLVTTMTIFASSCNYSAKNFSKYAKRVTTAKQLGEQPSQLNLNLAITYGIETIADCEDVLSKGDSNIIADSVKHMIKMRKSLK